MAAAGGGPNRRKLFDATLSGTQKPPFIPHLRSDTKPVYVPLPGSLQEFREQEGRQAREKRLRDLWRQLPKQSQSTPATERPTTIPVGDSASLTPERAQRLQRMYENELFLRCSDSTAQPTWKEFKSYAEAKEVELWHLFRDELDLDGNGQIDAHEFALALGKAGITLAPSTLNDFMTFLTSSPHSHAISFREFRDFLLLLPRKISTEEIYRYYEVKKFMGDDGRGAARVTMEGDVSLSAEDRPPALATTLKPRPEGLHPVPPQAQIGQDADDDEEEHHDRLEGHTALKFLLAGGIAGAVSRTSTAPFDRLKVFLITRPQDVGIAFTTTTQSAAAEGAALKLRPSTIGIKAITGAVARIYTEGGLVAFWTGNGLSVAKIFPESAIKFFTYESSKRMFANYWDGVSDVRDISGVSRFVSGGIGGITSQLSIYPIETLKTQMMSTGGERQTLVNAARHLWSLGGMRAYYRGLTIGLVGVFPYSAIDMSTFEALKLAYLRSTGKDEPGVLDLLAFGSISGSVGATSVYPLNMVRTRLQASGSSGHPMRYTGMWDVVGKTWEKEGWRGFYRGLFPTLAKVVPAVSISYVVYEHSKRRLGV